jgi:hypothetical protein
MHAAETMIEASASNHLDEEARGRKPVATVLYHERRIP